MNWLKDPFKRFLYIYWGLALLCVCLLMFTRETISFRMMENSIIPLLEDEAQYLETLWAEEGPTEAKQLLLHDQENIFRYQFKTPISAQAFEQAAYTEPEAEDAALFEESGPIFDPTEDTGIRTLTISDDEELLSTDIWLPVGEKWQQVVITLSPAFVQSQLRFIEPLLYSVIAVLLAGLFAAHYMIQGIKKRLRDVNQTSIDIRRAQSARHRIPDHNLSGPLAETIHEINAMLEELETAAEKTRQQANNIAHDLRTPLTSVYHRVQVLAQRQPELAEVEQMTEKLLSTFNMLLKISRLETNSERVEMETINLSGMVEDVLDLYGPVLEDRRQTLSVSIAENEQIVTSRALLFHALCNILDNSCKFNAEGSDIAIWTESTDERITLNIADQSGGAGKAGLSRLCEKFYRSDQSRQSEGNGLGLSFVSAAVRKMGGELSLSDDLLNQKTGLKVSVSFSLSEH
ncbi:sensor histidine kinase [Vibrio quintilis]|uniref:histidine kinase n=1 Tax=Vibrio quintilis TaxID=1117707 RepID=A0A1M7Z252_9VIBR|nr:HAMP domain-containing sensor histidine kinase [Vibrio quintilis]SHO58914.1 Sensor kinase CusS [Vibrio quintilis]